MKRALLVIALVLAAVSTVAGRSDAAPAGQCGLPDTGPWWIDFSSGSVSFRYYIFGHGGVIAATEGGPTVPATLRRHGAKTVYWEMKLGNIVGTTTAPKSPDGIEGAARKLYAKAVDANAGCTTPIIALNELAGAGTVTPWTANNAQYRDNVLALVRSLSALGARPFLLLATAPYTGGTAADWWREAARYSDIVPEVYFGGPSISRQGAVLGSRLMRRRLRQAVSNLTKLGIPANRVGFVLGFQNSPGGRAGLQPARAWYRVVKWEALAAKQVAAETGIGSVWSWGWGTFSSDHSGDEEKSAAACVYLWARDQSLCSGPAAAGQGFDDSLTEGQVSLPAGTQCTFDETSITTAAVDELARLTGDRQVAVSTLFQRILEQGVVNVSEDEIANAERTIVLLAFQGARSRYNAALANVGATPEVARALIGDELRRSRISASLKAEEPSEKEIQTFYRSYPTTPVREVRVSPGVSWLDGRSEGLALAAVAPAYVFALRTGVKLTLTTAEKQIRLELLGDALPLGAYPLEVARPAVRSALRSFSRGGAFETWTTTQQRAAQNRLICLRDDVPEPAAVDFGVYLPFLELNL
jgi:hypothetical protein